MEAPTASTIRIGTTPSTSAAATLVSTYPVGRSGVRRSCRVQPCERSTETWAPIEVVAIIEP